MMFRILARAVEMYFHPEIYYERRPLTDIPVFRFSKREKLLN